MVKTETGREDSEVTATLSTQDITLDQLQSIATDLAFDFPDRLTRIEAAIGIVVQRAMIPQADGSVFITAPVPGTFYQVSADGQCSCPDAKHRGAWCKHRFSLELVRRAQPQPLIHRCPKCGGLATTETSRKSIAQIGQCVACCRRDLYEDEAS